MSLSTFKNLKTNADFCPLCGCLLELPSLGDSVECNRCDFKRSILEFQFQPIVTTIKFSERKQWLETYKVFKGELAQRDDKEADTKAQIEQECPKCGYDRMIFWTMQIRSVDEGSTVFYECVKCKFRYQQHN